MLKTVTKKKSTKATTERQMINREFLIGPKYSLQFYFLSFILLLIICPHLTPPLYERSKDHIRWLNKYRSPKLDFLMHFFSIAGDGVNFPIYYLLIWASNFKTKRLTGQYLGNYLQ